LLARVAVVGFGVVAGISENGIEQDIVEGFIQHRCEAVHVHIRAPASTSRKDEVSGRVDDGFQLGEVLVDYGFLAVVGLAFGVIGTGMAGLKAGGIDGGAFNFFFRLG
jgi:hypothetical protein